MRRTLAALTTGALLLAGSAFAGPGLPELSDKQVETYRELSSKASQLLQSGNPSRASNLYERALRIHDGNEGTWYNAACAYALQNRTGEALDALEHARLAGWSDADWPQKDGDLESIRDTLGFEAWVARTSQAGGGEPWPNVDATLLADDAETIEERGDEWQGELSRLRGVLGSSESSEANRWIAAWTASSWDRIAARADDRDERAEASFEALAAVAGSDATRLSPSAAGEVVRRAENWLVENGDAEGAGLARLRLAEANFAQRRASSDETEKEMAQELFEQDLLLLAATIPPGEALEGALVRLIGFHSDDLDKAELLYARLLDASEDADATREKMRSGYSTRAVTYKIEGLPAFEMTTTDGVRMTATELPGRVTLLDFWATWCGPCRAELPNLKKAYEQYHDQGFDIVGISLDKESDKDQSAFLAWCEENGMPWPQVYDGQYWQSRMAKEFGVRAIPFALLVDDEGRVLAADDDLRGEKLAETIGEALSPGAPAVGGQ